MSDELTRLAGGVLWPGFLGTTAPGWLLEELRDGLAGVVYFGQNVGGDLGALSAQILEANPSALIGIDEEGGSVTRLETAALAGDDPRVRLDVAATTVEEQDAVLHSAVADEGTTVILIDRPDTDPAQRALVERAAQHDPAAVVVNVGLAARSPLPLPAIEVGAASRVGALVAREMLLGRVG